MSNNVFNHIQVNKVDNYLYLFVNGFFITKVEDSFEYRDYNSPVIIGQSSTLSSNLSIRIDELAIYRRKGFNIANFTVPNQPYN